MLLTSLLQETPELGLIHKSSHSVPSSSFKRKHDLLRPREANPPPKISLTRHPRWGPPRSSRDAGAGNTPAGVPEGPVLNVDSQTEARSSESTKPESTPHTGPNAKTSKRVQPPRCIEKKKKALAAAFKQPKHRTRPITKGPENPEEGAVISDPPCSRGVWLTAFLKSTPGVKDSGTMSPDEKRQVLESAARTKALVITMVHQDGTTQLDQEQVGVGGGPGTHNNRLVCICPAPGGWFKPVPVSDIEAPPPSVWPSGPDEGRSGQTHT